MRMQALKLGQMQTNCYIIFDEDGQAAVIDPGFTPEVIAKAIDSEGLTLKYILLTHGHFDHIGAVKALKGLYPDVLVAIGELDAPMIAKAADGPFVLRFITSRDDYKDIPVDVLLKDGDKIKLGGLELEVIHTPGHTLGGVCYKVLDKLFTGDTLFYEEIGRCDLEGGDYKTMLLSLARLRQLPGDYAVYPGHDAFSTLDHERAHNPYINRQS